MEAVARDVTRLLNRAAEDADARESLLQAVYRELHKLASRQMQRERADHTLQPTALVHETYLKLFDERPHEWENRGQFFAFAARVMRNLLIDHARRHKSQRQGGGIKLGLDEATAALMPSSTDLIALDQALERLIKFDPRQAQIVELRFFAGLTEEEIAEVLELGLRTVKRDWAVAKAWLYKELASEARVAH